MSLHPPGSLPPILLQKLLGEITNFIVLQGTSEMSDTEDSLEEGEKAQEGLEETETLETLGLARHLPQGYEVVLCVAYLLGHILPFCEKESAAKTSALFESVYGFNSHILYACKGMSLSSIDFPALPEPMNRDDYARCVLNILNMSQKLVDRADTGPSWYVLGFLSTWLRFFRKAVHRSGLANCPVGPTCDDMPSTDRGLELQLEAGRAKMNALCGRQLLVSLLGDNDWLLSNLRKQVHCTKTERKEREFVSTLDRPARLDLDCRLRLYDPARNKDTHTSIIQRLEVDPRLAFFRAVSENESIFVVHYGARASASRHLIRSLRQWKSTFPLLPVVIFNIPSDSYLTEMGAKFDQCYQHCT